MNSKDYWERREAEALKRYITDEKEYDKQIKRIYSDMLDNCQKEINAFYGKYASKEGITIAEAKKRVKNLDIEAYERKAKRYVKDKDFSPKANEEMRLYNATMKINRLEMLKANIGLELIAGHDELDKFMSGILKGRTEEELARQAGILGKTIKNNAKLAHAIPNASFHNATFSDRVWLYQDLMKADLSKLLQSGLIAGKNPRVLASELKNKFDVSTYNAERLMRTELARVQTEAQKQSFERNGFDEYEFIVNGGCCDICAALSGKHFKVAKMMPGLNAPPMHPHCRCSTAAYEDSEEYNAWLDYLSKGGTTAQWGRLSPEAKADFKKQLTNNSKNDKIQSKNTNNSPPVLVGGVNCTLSKSQYGFSDGAGGVRKTANATIYKTPDGTEFVFLDRYNKQHQTMTPEQAIANWQRVPQSIKQQAQKTVEVVDYYNPQDSYWRKHYKNFGHSYATGGDKITFYRYDTAHDDDYIVRTYCHEAGHFIDTNLATGTGNSARFSSEPIWQKAMADDKVASGKKSCTVYGENSPTEDFAESIAEYVKDKNSFTKDFPNRAAVLANII